MEEADNRQQTGGTRPREVGCEENIKGQEREEEGSELGKGPGPAVRVPRAGGRQVGDPRSSSYTWRLR